MTHLFGKLPTFFIVAFLLALCAEDNAVECYTESNGQDYLGYSDSTESNKPCQFWTSQSPHTHNVTSEAYPDSGVGDHNYCRNPYGRSRAWCFTNNNDTQWEYCNIGTPKQECSEEGS